MARAKQGDTVTVQYVGKLPDGTVFDTSYERGPLQFTIGQGQIIPGFEQAVIGMEVGENKNITLEPDQAYGPHMAEMVLEVERERFPEDIQPEVGQLLQVQQAGQVIPVTVTEVTEQVITLDANHPLAGKSLVFDIELVELAA